MSKLPKVTIYTDGSCEPNPGAGGWAALLLFPDKQIPLTGAEADTTNNRMELTAAVEALGALPERSEVQFYTDSEYLRRGITEWMPGWRARNWRRKGGKLANVDLQQADLTAADLVEADLSNADLRRARLNDADLHRANLAGADLRRATYTDGTRWPTGFDPSAAGAIYLLHT